MDDKLLQLAQEYTDTLQLLADKLTNIIDNQQMVAELLLSIKETVEAGHEPNS